MGSLKIKSDLNKNAADLLHDKSYYPSVVHCAYYSCIQLMKHAWLNTMGKSENDLKLLQESHRQNSHVILINQITMFIRSKSKDNSDKRNFNNGICALKKLRVESDYKNVIIDEDTSKESIDLSKSILNILEKFL